MRIQVFAMLVVLLIPAASAELTDYPGYPLPQTNSIANAITVRDINDDSIPEIIVAPQSRSILVYNPGGNLLWKVTAGTSTASTTVSPFIEDVNGDGKPELLLVGGTTGDLSYTHSIYIWNSAGTLLKSYNLDNGNAPSAPAYAGGLILAGISGGFTGINAYDMTGLKWQLSFPGGSERMNSIATGDLDGNGRTQAILSGGGKITAVDITSSGGSVRWQKDVAEAISPVIINTGGKKAVVASGSSGTFAWDAAGSLIWSRSEGSKYYYTTYSSPAVSDLNRDGSDDVIIVTGYNLYAISGIDGSILPGFPVSASGTLRSRPALYDIDGDSKPEIITGDSTGRLYIWDSAGKLIDGFPVRITDRVKSMDSSPAVYDLNNDGTPEIVIGSATHLHAVSVKMANKPPIPVITSPHDGDIYQLNDDIRFTSGSIDPDGSIITSKWYANGTLLCEGNTCTAKLPAGRHDIRLEVTDDKGATGNASITIRVNSPPAAVIDTPSNGSVYTQKDTASFMGHGTDNDGFIVSYQWVSDIDGLIGTRSSITSSNLSTGPHNITFTVTDNDGASDSTAIKIIQTGYTVEWDMKQKPVTGENSLSGSAGNKPVYKPGSMVPIKFTVKEDGTIVADTDVRVTVSDTGGREIFSALYGTGSKSVRINEEGKYIANFKSGKNDPVGTYKIDVTFGAGRKNQDFSKSIYLLDQKNTVFMNRAVGLKAVKQGTAFTYEWKLNNLIIGNGAELTWVPDSAGIYNIRLFVTNNKKTDTEDYSILVNAEGDANGDDSVNVLDLSLLGLNWGRVRDDTDFDDGADVNGDGVIDILDAVRIGKKWN